MKKETITWAAVALVLIAGLSGLGYLALKLIPEPKETTSVKYVEKLDYITFEQGLSKYSPELQEYLKNLP